jgi:photosystem II stability/assembly factor-like uncharacterized protein
VTATDRERRARRPSPPLGGPVWASVAALIVAVALVIGASACRASAPSERVNAPAGAGPASPGASPDLGRAGAGPDSGAPASHPGALSGGPDTPFPLFPEARRDVFTAQVLNLTDTRALAAVDVAEERFVTRLAVLRTDDGGRSWRRALDLDATFGAWVAVDPERLWLVAHLQRAGVSPELHRTTDGGQTWEHIDLESALDDRRSVVFYDGLTFRDAAVGALRREGVWLRTTDGGSTWSPGPPPDWAPRAPRDGPCRARATDGGFVIERDEGGWRAVCELAAAEL